MCICGVCMYIGGVGVLYRGAYVHMQYILCVLIILAKNLRYCAIVNVRYDMHMCG